MSVQAAVTTVPSSGWLKQQTFLFHSSEGGKFKIRAPAGLVAGEDLLPGSQTDVFL